MKEKIETTHKTTVTFSAKEFLKRLGLERSGKLKLVFVHPEHISFDEYRTVEPVVDIIFQDVQKTVEAGEL